ncbi:MAG: GTPase Era [Acholeplasmatales bacterium]|jgi:GTP-binding protein Era|nr:GTPase Era [Acholeplasmatales bacterium]
MGDVKNEFKSGVIGIFGITNTGKSTLLNTLINQKVSITADSRQTTLFPIYGILTEENYQMVFLDTPGVQRSKSFFDNIVQKSISSFTDGLDLIIHLVDSVRTKKDDYVLDLYKDSNTPVILAINKLDLLKNNTEIDKIILSFLDVYDYKAYIPLSAKNGKNVNFLKEAILKELQVGPLLYPEDEVTNITTLSLIKDLIREKVIYATYQEVVSSFFVEIEYIKQENGKRHIFSNIVVERDNQKKIIIGTKGSVIKKIRTLAKSDIKRTLGESVDLELFVKVNENWKSNEKDLKRIGLI